MNKDLILESGAKATLKLLVLVSDIGPGFNLKTITFDDLVEAYYEATQGLVEGGADSSLDLKRFLRL